jgi:hypothetical protein
MAYNKVWCVLKVIPSTSTSTELSAAAHLCLRHTIRAGWHGLAQAGQALLAGGNPVLVHRKEHPAKTVGQAGQVGQASGGKSKDDPRVGAIAQVAKKPVEQREGRLNLQVTCSSRNSR